MHTIFELEGLEEETSTRPQRQESLEEHIINLVIEENKTLKLTPNHFHRITVLGKGAYGKVYLVKSNNKNEKLYAMKTINKKSLFFKIKGVEHLGHERNILGSVNHPNIVKMHFAFQDDTHLYFIMDFIQGGELFHYMQDQAIISENTVRFYTAQCILALSYLHSLGIIYRLTIFILILIYRDLKPENILLDFKGNLILTDFGLSKVGIFESNHTNTICGTSEYMAPEILKEEEYNASVDWWSLGILLYDMLVGSPPFKGIHREQVLKSIQKKSLGKKIPMFISKKGRSLILSLLQIQSNKRLGSGKERSEEIKTHPFYSNINFEDLFNQKLHPPFRPMVKDPLDVSNFDQMFTKLSLGDSDDPSSPSSQEFEKDDDLNFSKNFAGFSYIAPGLSTSAHFH